MKTIKKVAVLLTIILFSGLASAQINPHALGLRLGGDGDINGAELSYQRGLGESHRLELDLGFGGNKNHTRMFLAGIYHWHWNLNGGLNWYVGPGAAVGLFSYNDGDGFLNIGLGGQIGLEFNFNSLSTPILLSIDGRPMWDFIGDNAGFGWGAALGIRYTW